GSRAPSQLEKAKPVYKEVKTEKDEEEVAYKKNDLEEPGPEVLPAEIDAEGYESEPCEIGRYVTRVKSKEGTKAEGLCKHDVSRGYRDPPDVPVRVRDAQHDSRDQRMEVAHFRFYPAGQPVSLQAPHGAHPHVDEH